MLNLMIDAAPEELAFRTAWRSDPDPLSAVVETVNVEAVGAVGGEGRGPSCGNGAECRATDSAAAPSAPEADGLAASPILFAEPSANAEAVHTVCPSGTGAT
jgi:hypothetical protein